MQQEFNCTDKLEDRDYHPMAHGTQIRMSLYPDRLEIANPGGLHGPLPRESLLVEPVSSISRNATLTKLLEDVQSLDDRRMIAENRGSGLLATAALLRRAGMDPPELRVRDEIIESLFAPRE